MRNAKKREDKQSGMKQVQTQRNSELKVTASQRLEGRGLAPASPEEIKTTGGLYERE